MIRSENGRVVGRRFRTRAGLRGVGFIPNGWAPRGSRRYDAVTLGSSGVVAALRCTEAIQGEGALYLRYQFQ